MLKKFNVTNYEDVSFIQSEDQSSLLIIVQANEYEYSYKEEIGRFDFSTKEGYLQLLNGNRKEYKRFNALLNNFFKYNEYFGWNSTVVNNCKEATKQQTTVEENYKMENYTFELFNQKNLNNGIKQVKCRVYNLDETQIEVFDFLIDENGIYGAWTGDVTNETTFNRRKEIERELNQTKEVVEVSEVIENNQTSEVNDSAYIVGNRTFTTYEAAYNYCIESDFEPELMIIKEAATIEPLNATNEQETNEQTEVFNVYNNTFTTYSEAYNYCIKNDYPVTMILSNMYPYMTTERLQELELQYKFSKHNMSIADMKELYDFVTVLPLSTDQEDRYYRLKGWIERYETKQRNIETKKQHDKEMAIQINNMISDLYSIGMIKKEYKHTNTTWYYLNNELIYNWSSGIPTEKMFNELTEIHNRHYKQSKAV
jgi:hypothetical protein